LRRCSCREVTEKLLNNGLYHLVSFLCYHQRLKFKVKGGSTELLDLRSWIGSQVSPMLFPLKGGEKVGAEKSRNMKD
jgi:hypothetical protein